MSRQRRPQLRRILGIAVAVAIIVAVFFNILPRIADYGAVVSLVEGLSPAQLALLAAVGVLNIATFPPPWMAALPGLTYKQALVLTQTSTALSSAVPGGDAVGISVSYAMLRQWRFNPPGGAAAGGVAGGGDPPLNIRPPGVAPPPLPPGRGGPPPRPPA